MTTLQQARHVEADAGPHRSFRWEWAAVVTMAAAGVLHVAAAAQHAAHDDGGILVAGFFLLTALAQLGAAAWLAWCRLTGTRMSPAVLLGFVAGTVALLGLYVVVHTTDLLAGVVGDHGQLAPAADHGGEAEGHQPIGPLVMGGEVGGGGEPVEPLGTATVTAEVLGIMALSALLPPTWRARTVNALLGLGCLAWLLWLVGVLR